MSRSPVLLPCLFLALTLVSCVDSSGDGGRGSDDGVLRTSGLEGRIVDAATDTSLGGVSVSVDGGSGVTSSSDGRFELDEPESGDAPLIRFTLDGYREEFLTRSGLLDADEFPGIEPAVDGGTRDVGTIRLVPDEFAGEGGLSGRITDPDGQPVGGVTIRLLRGLFTTTGEAEATTGTDASGAWDADGLPDGNYTLVVLPPDRGAVYRTVQVFGDTTRTGQDVSVPAAPAGLFSQEADESTWMLDGPARTVDYNADENSNGWGQALLRVGDVLLVGGDFEGIRPNIASSATSRPFLAVLDAVSGQPVSTFQVPSQVDSVVRSLALSPDREQVYVGGDFGLLVLDAATGALELAPSVSGGGESGGRVFDIAVHDTLVYIGGDFSAVDGQPRSNIARLSLDGELDPAWSPDNVALGLSDGRSAPVESVAVSPSGNTVYVGGTFQSIDDVPVPRTPQNSRVSMLSLSADDGTVLPERFMPDVGDVVKGVTARDIAATEFYVIVAWGGANHLTFHSTGGDRLRQYNGKGDVQFLQLFGDKVFVGHHGEFFNSVANPIPPEAVVSVEPEILVPYKFHSFRIDDPSFLYEQAWRISGPFGVWGIAASEDSVWVAGDISMAGSNDRAVEGLARFPASDQNTAMP